MQKRPGNQESITLVQEKQAKHCTQNHPSSVNNSLAEIVMTRRKVLKILTQ